MGKISRREGTRIVPETADELKAHFEGLKKDVQIEELKKYDAYVEIPESVLDVKAHTEKVKKDLNKTVKDTLNTAVGKISSSDTPLRDAENIVAYLQELSNITYSRLMSLIMRDAIVCVAKSSEYSGRREITNIYSLIRSQSPYGDEIINKFKHFSQELGYFEEDIRVMEGYPKNEIFAACILSTRRIEEVL